nr:hypothetical protein [Tanacetum cinerariifolium]
MTRKPSISRRNRINWHYVRDDVLFSTIKVVSRHQTTQQYGVILPIELTTDEIRNRSDDDSNETVKIGAGKDDDDNDEEEELPKSDEEDTETGKGGDE